MRTCLLLGLLLWVAAAQAGVEGGVGHSDHPDWMTPGLVDLQADLETVHAQDKVGVMVLFTTRGCSYCGEFIRRSLEDPILGRRVRDNFVVVALEIFDDVEMTDHQGVDLPIKEFAVRHQATMAPTLLFFTPGEGLALRAVGYQSPERFGRTLDYLVGGHATTVAFRDFIRSSEPPGKVEVYPALRADALFERPPYALTRTPVPASQPLLVLFEKTGCEDCARFHDDVLALPEVRATLQRFDVVRLDADDQDTGIRMPGGGAGTPAGWFADAGFSRVPALLFVNETGDRVFATDALVERQRMLNSMGLVLDRAYEQGWSYQRYARTKAIERNRQTP